WVHERPPGGSSTAPVRGCRWRGDRFADVHEASQPAPSPPVPADRGLLIHSLVAAEGTSAAATRSLASALRSLRSSPGTASPRDSSRTRLRSDGGAEQLARERTAARRVSRLAVSDRMSRPQFQDELG